MEPRAGFEPATSALPNRSLNNLLEEFRLFCGVDLQLADRTVREHNNRIARILKGVGKEYNKVSKDDLRAYIFDFKQDHANATVAGIIKTLKVFYRDFLDCPKLVASFRFPQIPFKPKVVPTQEELQRFFGALDSEQGEALFLFFATSGLRKSEVLSLTFNDVDFKKRMIIPKCHHGTTKNSYVSFYNEETEKALNKLELDNNRIFNISDRQYKKLFNSAIRESGLHITAKRLRDWFCCEMGSLGVSDRYIDAFCGRTPKSVLARHYTDYNPERLKEIYEKANLKVIL